MMNGSELDAVDYGILTCVEEEEQVWKKRVHELISERQDVLPEMKNVSIQTVGRRINNLQEKGLLESCILSPENLNRDLIIGYTVTEDGQLAMHEKRESFLKENVLRSGEYLFNDHCHDTLPVNREALNHLFCKHFGVGPQKRDVVEACETEEILAVLAIHYFRGHLEACYDEYNVKQMTDLVEAAAPLKESFQQSSLASKLIRRVQRDLDAAKEIALPNQ